MAATAKAVTASAAGAMGGIAPAATAAVTFASLWKGDEPTSSVAAMSQLNINLGRFITDEANNATGQTKAYYFFRRDL